MIRYPFSPERLDALPEEIAELFRGLEDTLLEEICSRLNISGQLNEVTVQAIRALRAQGISLEEIQRAIAETTGVTQDKLDALLDDVVERNKAYYGELATLADVTMPDSVVSAATIDAIKRQTKDELVNLTRTMGFAVRQNGRVVRFLESARAFQWALDQAEAQVLSGAISYDRAIANATKQLADSGLRTVRYENNGNIRYDHVDVAARRAVMSGVNQICQRYAEQSMERLGTDLVEVSAHKGARNTGFGPANHAGWQGKVYHWRK